MQALPWPSQDVGRKISPLRSSQFTAVMTGQINQREACTFIEYILRDMGGIREKIKAQRNRET